MSDPSFRQALIDLDAIRSNMRILLSAVDVSGLAIVKANAYGHGAAPVARAALEGGAKWLGVADLGEARELRAAGITAPILAWLHGEGSDFETAITDDISIGVSSADQLGPIADAAQSCQQAAMLQIKVDTGLSRNGIPESEWAGVARDLAELEKKGLVQARGVFSHLSNASADDDERANRLFCRAIAVLRGAGLNPDIVHLAGTAAALRYPKTRHTVARFGIGMYGLSPCGSREPWVEGLIPAMTVQGRVVSVRRIPAGAGVSYDYTYRTPRDTTVALVPLGYADGVPRSASACAEVQVRGRRYPVRGRIAMDQFVVDMGDDPVAVGDVVVVFGDPATGVPSVSDWAEWAGTIHYEIMTRVGSRVTRQYRG